MSKLQRLKSSFQNHTFIGDGQVGNDYKQFESAFKEVIKEITNNINAKIVSFNNGHYYFSAFVEKDNKYVYISIEDVRHVKNGWRDNILVRTAKDSTDYTGGRNTFTSLDALQHSIDLLLP